MEELVTVKTFTQSSEFEMAKSYLESNEIECFGQDEILNGEVKLQVRSNQAKEAIKLLFDGGYLKAKDFAEINWVEKILVFSKLCRQYLHNYK